MRHRSHRSHRICYEAITLSPKDYPEKFVLYPVSRVGSHCTRVTSARVQLLYERPI